MGWYVDRVADNFRSLLDIYVCLAEGYQELISLPSFLSSYTKHTSLKTSLKTKRQIIKSSNKRKANRHQSSSHIA